MAITDEAEAFDPILKKFRMVSVPKLIERTRDRKPSRIHIAKIWGGTKESPGFSEERLKNTDTKHPILVDSYYEGDGKSVGLVDGRHRKLKLQNKGQKTARIIKITKEDIDHAAFSRSGGIIQFMADEPLPHQRRVALKLRDPKRRGLVVMHGLGSGKTRTAIEAHKEIGGKADVVLPAALKANYQKEIKKWGANPADSNIISQQGAAVRGQQLTAKTLIVDEGHRARNPKTKLSAIIKNSKADKRIILSGTPIYNNPADIATLVNQAAGKDVLREGTAFKNRYLKPNILDRFRGKRISHEGELKKTLNEYVDYHKGGGEDMPTVKSKTIPILMGKHQSALYRAAMGKIPHSLRMNTANIERLKPYLTGPRMVSNTSKALDPKSSEEPKLDKIVSDAKRHLEDPKGKTLIYSNWIEHGVHPISKKLTAAGIPHGVFTGKETMKERNQHVTDYNAGKTRALIVSSSGGEGLDLKGTRMVQVAEPHFNNAKIRQVVGRSARIGSHSHLPKEERNVEVRQYIARPKRRFLPGHAKGVEDILADTARSKDETDKQITALLRSKMKTITLGASDIIDIIRFAKSGEMAKKYLIRTHYTDDPNDVGPKILDAVTKRKDPIDKEGKSRVQTRPGTGGYTGIPSPVKQVREKGTLRDMKASDQRDTKGYKSVKAEQLANQGKESLKIKLIKAKAAGITDPRAIAGIHKEHKDSVRQTLIKGDMTKEIQQTRDSVARQLRTTHALIIKDRRNQGIPKGGKIETIPGRITGATRKQHGAAQPLMGGEGIEERIKKGRENLTRMVPEAQAKSKVQAGNFHQELHNKVVAHMRKNIPAGATKKTGKELESHISGAAHDLIKRTFDRAVTTPIIGPEPAKGSELNSHYGPLAERLGTTPQRVHKIHQEYNRLNHPNSVHNTRGIVSDLIKKGNIFRDAPKAPSALPKFTGTKSAPTLKKIGVGLGIAGGIAAGSYIARKLSKKTEMSDASALILFARGEQYLKLIKKTRSLTSLPKTVADKLSMRVAAAEGKTGMFQGHKKSLGVRRTIQSERDLAASEARNIRTGMRIAPKLKQAERDVTSEHFTHRIAKEREGMQVNIREIEKNADARVSESQAEAAAVKATHKAHLNRALNSQAEEHTKKISGLHKAIESNKRSSRKAIGIAAASGVGVGGIAGYIAGKPEKEMEFGVGDMVRNVAAKTQCVLWTGERKAKKAWREIQRTRPAIAAIGHGAAKGFMTGIPGGTEVGALAGGIKHMITKKPSSTVDEIMARLPKKKAIRLASGLDTIRFVVRKPINNEEHGSLGHDVTTGALEGGAVGPFTEPLFAKLKGEPSKAIFEHGVGSLKSWKGLGKNALIGAGLGAASTGLIGGALSLFKKTPTSVDEELSSCYPLILFTAVTQDRYRKHIHEIDAAKSESNYLRTALGSGALGVLLRNKGTKLSKAAGIGAAAGVGIQALTRINTATTKDQFGDRSYAGKRVDNAPHQIAALATGGLLIKRGMDKAKAWEPTIRAAKATGEKFVKAAKKIFVSTDPVIEFRDWTDKWTGGESGEINVNRRTEDVRRIAGRTSNILSDIKGVVKGEKPIDSRGRPRKREWDKPWVHKAILGGVILGTAAGYKGISHVANNSGPGTAMGELGALIKQGKVKDLVRKKVPGYAKAEEAVGKFKQKIGDETAGIGNRKGGLIHKVVNYIKKETAHDAPKEAYEVVNGVKKTYTPGTKAHADFMKKKMAPADAAEIKKAEDAAKDADKKIRRDQSGETMFAVEENEFDPNLEYRHYAGDRHKQWVHSRPGIAQRNRRPKTLLEKKAFQDDFHTVKEGGAFLAGTLAGAFLLKKGTGGKAAHKFKPPVEKSPGMKVSFSSGDPITRLNAKLEALIG